MPAVELASGGLGDVAQQMEVIPMEPGKCYYVIYHAYHHFIIRVVEMLGPRRPRFDRCEKIHSCRRGWTEFFRDGAERDTQFMIFPPGEFEAPCWWEWKHPLPSEEEK